MKLLFIEFTSDPYEPSGLLACCTSVEGAKKLGFKRIWNKTEVIYKRQSDSRKFRIWKDLITGEAIGIQDNDISTPTPSCYWQETNLLIDAEMFEKYRASFDGSETPYNQVPLPSDFGIEMGDDV